MWTKLLCGVDFSPCSGVALDAAGSLAAAAPGALLVIAHVHRPGLGEPDLRALDARLEALRAEWARTLGEGKVETRLLPGDPAEELPRLARDGRYDLVVVGTHGRAGVKRLLLGSVAEAAVRSSPGAVLVVRGAPCFDFTGED